MSYIFLLGRKDKLSFAELQSRLDKVTKITDKFALYEGEITEDSQKFLNSLGGTIKICKIIGEIKNPKDCENFVINFLKEHFKDSKSKINFGISAYSIANGHEISVKNLLKNSKKNLQNSGIKSRFVNKNFENVANTAIHDSGLLRHGVEICIFKNDKTYVAKTVAVQDFKSYGFRDYERPARDQKSGMLPPKLAQVMINFSGIKKGQTLYDPFCGSGTVLMEGLLMGLDVKGSDISEKAIKDSQTNLEWLEQYFKFNGKWEVFIKDAREPQNKLKVDAIVAETYLGPPLFKFPGEQNAKDFLEEASKIITGFLEVFELKIPIVLAIPFIRDKREIFHIENFVEKAGKLGYSVSALNKEQKTLLYDRPEQIVGREIVRLMRK